MLKDFFLWFYWYPFRLFVQKIPPKNAYRLARIYGVILYYLSSRRRNALRQEFNTVLGGFIGEKDSSKVLRDSLTVLYQNEIEMMLFSELNAENIGNFVKYSGMENLDKALAEGRGVMLLFSHFGANQMIMPAIGYQRYKMSQMSAPATVWVDLLPDKKFSAMEKRALELREAQEMSLPVKHINIFGSIKSVFSCLKKNEVLGIAIDGGAGKDRVAVDFFGVKISLSTGAVRIAMKTGCPVLPTFIVRERDGKHTLIIEPPLNIQDTGKEDAVRSNMLSFIRKLEEYVVKYPSHYLNFLALRRFMEPHEQESEHFFVGKKDS